MALAAVSKAKPQRYREGALYQRASDGLWVATIEAGWTAKGTRRRVTVSGRTEAAARRKLRDKRLQIEREGLTSVSSRATVKTWAAEWLGIQERRLAPNSFAATRSAVTRWIVPTIGHKRFDLLTPADVRAVATAQRADGRSSSTQLRTHSVLTSLLKAAMAEGYPVPQRLLVVGKPARAISDRTDMSVPEAVALLEQASLCIPHASRYVAALLQGMRQGEALGLTREQVDLERNTLTISWQLQSLRYRVPRDRSSGFRVPDGYEARHLRGALHLVRPKSESGKRVIPLVPWMRSALEAWLTVAPDSPHGLVWPNLDGEPTYYKIDDEEWYALQSAADVHHPTGRWYTIHEARHTTATLLLEAGIDPAVITAILGHSSIVTSRSYMHVNQRPALAALELVAQRLQLG